MSPAHTHRRNMTLAPRVLVSSVSFLALLLVSISPAVAGGDGGLDGGHAAISIQGALSSMGHHTCALRPDGEAVCWASDGEGESSPPGGGYSYLGTGPLLPVPLWQWKGGHCTPVGSVRTGPSRAGAQLAHHPQAVTFNWTQGNTTDAP
jgi:hypothetical protein